MAKAKVGIYWGKDSISAVVVEGKKVLHYTDNSFSSLEPDILNLQENARWEKLLNKTLKSISNIDIKKINLCVSDKDFLLRALNLPLMNKKELDTAIVFEIEKVVPFKIEELVWDYKFSREARDINVAFIGMKKNTYDNYLEIINKIGLEVDLIEFSSLALFRLLRMHRQTSARSNFAFLDFTEKESYLTFFYNSLPIFNRPITVEMKSGEVNRDRLIEEIRISWEYFQREFPRYKIDNFIIICEQENTHLFSQMNEYINLEKIEIILPEDFIPEKGLKLNHLKAYSLALSSSTPLTPKFVLRDLERTVPVSPVSEGVEVGLGEYAPIDWSLVIKFLGIGIIVLSILWIVMDSWTKSRELALKVKKDSINIPVFLKDKEVSYQTVKDYIDDLDKKNKIIIEELNSFMRISPVLRLFSSYDRSVLGNTWLSYLKIDGEKGNVLLKGYSYLGDSSLEKKAIEGVQEVLKNHELFKKGLVILKGYKSVSLKKGEREYSATQFEIEIKIK